jgi:hypothetical protein
MTKLAFRIGLAFLALLLLFSISPLAPWGGMIVVGILIIPAMLLFGIAGGNLAGPAADNAIAMLFLGMGVMVALAALAFFYLAAAQAERERPEKARIFSFLGLITITIPLAMYLCFRSLQF